MEVTICVGLLSIGDGGGVLRPCVRGGLTRRANGGVQIGCARGSGETGQGYFGTTSLPAKLLARARIDGGRPVPQSPRAKPAPPRQLHHASPASSACLSMTSETLAAKCTLPLRRPQQPEHPQRHPAAEEDASPSTRHAVVHGKSGG